MSNNNNNNEYLIDWLNSLEISKEFLVLNDISQIKNKHIFELINYINSLGKNIKFPNKKINVPEYLNYLKKEYESINKYNIESTIENTINFSNNSLIIKDYPNYKNSKLSIENNEKKEKLNSYKVNNDYLFYLGKPFWYCNDIIIFKFLKPTLNCKFINLKENVYEKFKFRSFNDVINLNLSEIDKNLEKKCYIKNKLKDLNLLFNYYKNLNNGIFVGDLINKLERKKVIKYSNEVFYKKNIYYNFQNAFEFLLKTNSFKSNFLFKFNIINNEKLLNEFVYDILIYYDKKYEEINKIKNKVFIRINSSNKLNFTEKKSNFEKYREELLNIRKNINYIHNKNKSSSNLLKKSPKKKIFSRQNKKIINKNPISFGIDSYYDSLVTEITNFLSDLNIDSMNIDFYDNKELIEFKDGILLYKIIYNLELNKNLLPKIDFNPKLPTNAIMNYKKIINFLFKNKKKFDMKFYNNEKELQSLNDKKLFLEFLKNIKEIYKEEINYIKNINYYDNYYLEEPKKIDLSERENFVLDNFDRKKILKTENNNFWY